MPFTLEGRSALVTGSGRGIGLAIASELAGWGASVMISDIDEAAAREAAGCLGSPARFVAGDLTLAEFPQTLVDATVGAFGSLDIIVNNAGYTWDNVIQKTTDEQFQAMLDIHIVAPFRVLRAASGWLREAAG
jgi:3-oxoacyl-[acyl-carrier protein] reductase